MPKQKKKKSSPVKATATAKSKTKTGNKYLNQSIYRPIPPPFQHFQFVTTYTYPIELPNDDNDFVHDENDNTTISKSNSTNNSSNSSNVIYMEGTIVKFLPSQNLIENGNGRMKIPDTWIVEYPYYYNDNNSITSSTSHDIKQEGHEEQEGGDGEKRSILYFTEQITESELLPALTLATTTSTTTSSSSDITNSFLNEYDKLHSYYNPIQSENTTNALTTYIDCQILWKLILCSLMEIELESRVKNRLDYLLKEENNNKNVENQDDNDGKRRRRGGNRSINKNEKEEYMNVLPKWYTQHPTSYLGGHYKPKPKQDSNNNETIINNSDNNNNNNITTNNDILSHSSEVFIGTTSSTPSTISSRIKMGIQKACEYYFQSNPHLLTSTSSTTTQDITNTRPTRTSKRLQSNEHNDNVDDSNNNNGSTLLQKPNVLENGGCVALFLIQLLDQEDKEQKKLNKDKTGKGGEYLYDDAADDDDDDGGLNHNDDGDNTMMEDDPEEGESDGDDTDDEEENDDDDDDDDFINPHYKPSILDIYTHLYQRINKPSLSITPAEIQNAICNAMDDSIECCLPLLQPALILKDVHSLRYQLNIIEKEREEEETKEKEMVNVESDGNDENGNRHGEKENEKVMRVTLECDSDESLKELYAYELATFARCRFRIHLFNEDEEEDEEDGDHEMTEDDLMKQEEERQLLLLKEQERKHNELMEFRREEKAWRTRKQYETWRFMCIQSGRTIWPTWNDYAAHLIKSTETSEGENGGKLTIKNEVETDQITPMSIVETNGNRNTLDPLVKQENESNDEQTAKDFELAQQIAQTTEESITTLPSRRSRRSAQSGADGGNLVFYGSQQSFSVQQLLESVERLIVQSWPRGMMLLELKRLLMDEGIGGERSNRSSGVNLYGSMVELKKVRAALGKLMFRMGKIDRILVSADSDIVCRKMIEQGDSIVSFAEIPLVVSSMGTKNVTATDDNVPDKEEVVVHNKGDIPITNDVSEENQEEISNVKVEAATEDDDEILHDAVDKSGVDITLRERNEITMLENYLSSMHSIELRLRKMLLQQNAKGANGGMGLQQISPTLVSIAADERQSDPDGMDRDYFFKINEDGNFCVKDDIEWITSPPHPLLGQIIHRPNAVNDDSSLQVNLHSQDCSEYKVISYCPSKPIDSNGNDPTATSNEIKDSNIVERRIRFRAVPCDESEDFEENAIILTEGQVRAGISAIKYAESLSQQESKASSISTNPFAGTEGISYLLYPLNGENENESGPPLHSIIVGHDIVATKGSGEIEMRVLILIDNEIDASSKDKENAFWATLNSDGSCVHRIDTKTSYRLEPQEYHPSSPAYQACETVLSYLRSQIKIMPFLEPVDPIVLGIPDYFDVIKNPMDISTMEKKLADGKYGRFTPSGEYSSSTCKMLFGPFYRDLMLIFDNAMLYNPKGDWIHNDAKALRGLASKKVQTIGMKAERDAGFEVDGSRSRTRNQSVYVEVDSDEDMYEYESDYEDDANFRGKRKRSKAKSTKVEDFATRAIETPVRLPSLADSHILSKLPIVTQANLFGLPSEWSCRPKSIENEESFELDDGEANDETEDREREELIMLQMHLDQQHQIRRSARSHVPTLSSSDNGKSGFDRIDVGKALDKVEYFIHEENFSNLLDFHEIEHIAKDRENIESVREILHEEFFAKLYYKYCSNNATKSLFVESKNGDDCGVYTKGYFPPFLGRIVPSSNEYPFSNSFRWEIRSQYAIPALRWILRGLVQSGHLVEWEPASLENIDIETSLMTNHIYYKNKLMTPYEVLDVKEMQRRKRVENEKEDVEDEAEPVELSAYEQMRADRVARNKERLKALGLA